MNFGSLESYNKGGGHKSHGTLVGNWFEEAKLKEETGQSRLSYPKHKQKAHKQLFDETKVTTSTCDTSVTNQSTAHRIFGGEQGAKYQSINSEYGKGENPADKLPRIGRKHLLIQKQVFAVTKILETVIQDLKVEQEVEERKYFGDYTTTNQIEYKAKAVDPSLLGKKRMCNQNGERLPSDARDYDFLSQIGMVKRPALASDKELMEAISKEHYSKQQPITFYTEKYHDGCIYKSEGSGANMFGRKVGKPLYNKAVN